MSVPELSIVVPMFNEEAVLPLFAARLRPVADGLETAYEVVAVDDGSSDGTAIALQKQRRVWPQLRVVRLRANAGHQAAISAGLALATGAYVVTLDADLQDPPEVIAESSPSPARRASTSSTAYAATDPATRDSSASRRARSIGPWTPWRARPRREMPATIA